MEVNAGSLDGYHSAARQGIPSIYDKVEDHLF